MHRYAEIIIDISKGRLDHPFTYRIPSGLQEKLRLGSFVQVPFGRGNTPRKGYVVGFPERVDMDEGRIKEIAAVLAAAEADDEYKAVRLAAWMKRRYGGTMITALKTVLPARKHVQPLQNKQVRLLLSKEEALRQLAFCQKKHQVARARVLESLLAVREQPYSLITGKLHIPSKTLLSMEKAGILKVDVTTSLRNPVGELTVGNDILILNDEQRTAVNGVLSDFTALQEGRKVPFTSLIYGITGSGKTQVYISIIERIVKQGRQAIMLIPEISLTYQTLLRFYRHFGSRVSVMNSQLSEGEKSDQFERARRGEIDVIIGPRSSLFTPFQNIGVIVIDEEHEASYKNESMPKYHARDVARAIASMHRAVLVLGSATPSLDSYYHAKRGDYRLYTLTSRPTGGVPAHVVIADMREELRRGNKSILSRPLREKLEDRLSRKEQSMLFLNRRGYSGFVSCRSCGHVMKCPHCDVALSLHRGGRLVCHYCGYEQPAVRICPECGSRYIAGFRAGTEQIEEALRKEYPKARILRMDADTTTGKGSFEKILSAFANEEADILLGTQMIVKGHDFPKVTLMGILLADLSLYSNDYRAAERTFQLLTQAAGRAGRGEREGDVVIQTYEPEHYAVQYAAAQDYAGFYNEELAYRKALLYPPVHHMLAVQISAKTDDHAQYLCGRIREKLDHIAENRATGLLLIGPAPARVSRIKDTYRYVLYIKSEKYATLIDCKDAVEALCLAAAEDKMCADTMVQFDFDPVNPY